MGNKKNKKKQKKTKKKKNWVAKLFFSFNASTIEKP